MLSLYQAKQTWLHQWSPGRKLLVLLLATILVLRWPLLAPVLLLAVVLLYAQLGLLSQWRSLRPLLPLLLLMTLADWWQQGSHSALLLLSRVLSLLLLANLISLTTKMQRMIDALQQGLRPLAPWLPVHRLAFAMALFMRMVPLLLALLARLSQSWQSRGGLRLGQWRLLMPLVVQNLLMAERLADALAARGGMPQQIQLQVPTAEDAAANAGRSSCSQSSLTQHSLTQTSGSKEPL